MRDKFYRLAAGLYTTGVFTAAALGRSESAADEPAPVEATAWDPSDRWTVQIEPMVWFAAMKGDVTFRNGSTFELQQVDMDEVHAAPAGRFSLRASRWTFEFSGASVGFEDDGRADTDIDTGTFTVAAGDRVDFDLTYSAFKLTAGYAFDPIIRDDESEVALWVDAYGGVQLYHLDFEFGPSGADDRINVEEAWLEPLVGVRFNINLPRGFEVGVSLDAGAAINGGTGFAWDISPSFRWFPMENKTVAIEVGFRHLAADLSTGDDEDFQFDTFTAGLFASVVIRF